MAFKCKDRVSLPVDKVYPGRRLKLSALERRICKASLAHGTTQFGAIVCMSGPDEATPQVVTEAVRLAQRRHPLLRCKLIKHKKKLLLEESDIGNNDPVVEVSSKSGVEAWNEYSPQPLQLDSCAPVPHIIIATGSEDNSVEIVFAFNHAFADGVSVVKLIPELVDLMARGEDALDPVGLGYTVTYEQGIRSYWKEMGGLKFWSQFLPMSRQALISKASFKYKGVNSCNIARKTYCHNLHLSFSEEETKTMLAFCKKNSISFGTYCMAVSTLTANDFLNPRMRKLLINTVNNTRAFYPDHTVKPEDLGFHVSILPPLTYKKRKRNVILLANEFAVSIKSEKAENYSATSLAPLKYLMGRNLPFFIQSSITVSNWGRMNIDSEYGAWKIDRVVPLYALNNMVMPTLGFLTSVKKLTVVVAASSAVKEAYLENFRKALQDNLIKYTEGDMESHAALL